MWLMVWQSDKTLDQLRCTGTIKLHHIVPIHDLRRIQNCMTPSPIRTCCDRTATDYVDRSFKQRRKRCLHLDMRQQPPCCIVSNAWRIHDAVGEAPLSGSSGAVRLPQLLHSWHTQRMSRPASVVVSVAQLFDNLLLLCYTYPCILSDLREGTCPSRSPRLPT